jgi:hypothetical protein
MAVLVFPAAAAGTAVVSANLHSFNPFTVYRKALRSGILTEAHKVTRQSGSSYAIRGIRETVDSSPVWEEQSFESLS